jgi:hypothetical protein
VRKRESVEPPKRKETKRRRVIEETVEDEGEASD